MTSNPAISRALLLRSAPAMCLACAVSLMAPACVVDDRPLNEEATTTGGGDACAAFASGTCLECANAACSATCSQCTSTAACMNLNSCFGTCTQDDTNCQDACINQYPAGMNPMNLLATCVSSHCASACGF